MDNKIPLDGTSKNIFHYLSLFVSRRRLIIINTVTVGVLATIVSFLLPKWYESKASVLPPKGTDLLGGLAGIASIAKEFAPIRNIPILGGDGDAYNYLAILNSRTAMERVVQNFDLINVYEISDSSMEKTLEALEDNVDFEIEKEGNIVISVVDKDPQRAADMANYFVEVLNEISIELNSQEAQSNREFIEQRYFKNLEDLKTAEGDLQAFQKKYGVYSLPVPELGVEYLRLYREVEIQSKLLEFMVPLYEQAKFEEKKEKPSVLVLDIAVPAERKSWPKRLLIIFLSSFSAFLLSLFYVVTRARWDSLREIHKEQYTVMKSLLRRRRVPSQ
ncbi:MAG: Wzz/FepE/Etk N-terminal domain-containing protein [Bacteroidota bacterium]